MKSSQANIVPDPAIGNNEEGPSMRSWLTTLENADQLHRVSAQVDWDQELSAIARVKINRP